VLCCAVSSAGAGGDEAGIWAGDLLRMYQRYASNQGWKASMISCVEADAGGYKEVVLEVRQGCGGGGGGKQAEGGV
jgi:peptide chain release factor 1